MHIYRDVVDELENLQVGLFGSIYKYSFSHTFISYSSFKTKGYIMIITYQIIIKLNENIHHKIATDIQPNNRNVAI